MAKNGCRIGCSVFFIVLALLSLAASLFLFFGFHKIYDNQITEVCEFLSNFG
jgi:hypothetical protein